MKKISVVIELFIIVMLIAVLAVTVYAGFNGSAENNTRPQKLCNLSSEALRDALNYNDNSDSFRKKYLISANGGMTSLTTKDDLKDLPYDLLNDGDFGMQIYNGNSYVPYYGNENVFSIDKKTIFFIHGMGKNGTFYNPKNYYNDYNILSFFWGAFANEGNIKMPLVGDKTWFYDGNLRYYSKTHKKWIEDADINYSVVELYFAYYYDIISSLNGYDKEITVSGHSYGGMITYGLLSYLTNAVRNNLLSVSVLPDNVTLFDPYLLACESSRHVRWLGNMQNPTDFGGAIILAKQAVYDARILGIAVSLMRTSPVIEYPTQSGLDPHISDTTAIDKFNSQFLYVFGIANGMLDLSSAHNYGYQWPAMITSPLYDSVYNEEYSFSLLNPYHSKFARMGSRYIVNYNRTPHTVEDDTITLSNPDIRKIYGFVYVDENKNSIPDERITSHVCGVKVVIKDSKGKTVFKTTTSANGYYELPTEPGTYEISVQQTDGIIAPSPITITITEQTHFCHASFAIELK